VCRVELRFESNHALISIGIENALRPSQPDTSNFVVCAVEVPKPTRVPLTTVTLQSTTSLNLNP
jgi:hypothetical protein